MKRYYHATTNENFQKMLHDGVIKRGFDNIVYLTETKEAAVKFVSIRCVHPPIIVIEVELDEKNIIETFDHSYTFFKCKSFGCTEDIPTDKIVNVYTFDYHK